MGCDHSVAQQAAAQKALPASGKLTPGCILRNLNGHGRADSILRPIDLLF